MGTVDGGPVTDRPGRHALADRAVIDARRCIAERLHTAMEPLIESMIASYREEIPSYAALVDPAMVEEVRVVTRDNVAALLRAAVAGVEPFGNEVVGRLQDFGTRRAHQGFPLEAVLRAYQVGTRVSWHFVLDQVAGMDLGAGVASAVLASVSTSILETTAKISQVVADAFTAAERESATRLERTRRDCVDALLRGDADPGLPDRAAAAGLHVRARHAVCIAAIEGVDAQPVSRELARVLAEVRPRGCAPWIDVRSDRVCAIFAVGTGVTDDMLLDELRARLRGIGVPNGVVAQVAVGCLEEGQAGIAQSYTQAVRTLRVVPPEASGAVDVRSYGEALPDLVVAADPRVARDLYLATAAPLVAADATDADGRLVATLRAYLAAQQSSTGAARSLDVHRHTVMARLKRIEELTNRSLADHRDVLALELGLIAARLLGSPHTVVAPPCPDRCSDARSAAAGLPVAVGG